VIVTHEPRLAALCPRVIHIEDGRIISDGAPAREGEVS
jgi:ABC-type lipoprotein export system ATPase subunit